MKFKELLLNEVYKTKSNNFVRFLENTEALDEILSGKNSSAHLLSLEFFDGLSWKLLADIELQLVASGKKSENDYIAVITQGCLLPDETVHLYPAEVRAHCEVYTKEFEKFARDIEETYKTFSTKILNYFDRFKN